MPDLRRLFLGFSVVFLHLVEYVLFSFKVGGLLFAAVLFADQNDNVFYAVTSSL